tara:strand:+ start:1686 stop:1895 length:210 start_codon:yes stop_codon:yes gene_type:complete
MVDELKKTSVRVILEARKNCIENLLINNASRYKIHEKGILLEVTLHKKFNKKEANGNTCLFLFPINLSN